MNWPPFIDIVGRIDALGWALLLAVCNTTLLSLGMWIFLHTRSGRSPAPRHAIALGALVASVLLFGATWWGLERVPPSTTAAATTSAPVAHGATTSLVATDAASSGRPRFNVTRSAVAILSPALRWVSAGWLIGVALLAIRLVGGVLIGWRIRQRATPVTSGPVVEAVGRLARLRELEQPIVVALSDEVNAPSVAGWRRPVLLLPRDVDASLAQKQLESVVVHELEHVRRGDPWLAVIQAASSAILFFCPGTHWLSRQALEAREQRCDDAAIQVCGDPKAYASALGVLASRSSGTWLAAAMGQQAPSLAARIRRVVKGDVMPVITPGKFVAVASGVVLTIATGAIVLAASLEQVTSVDAHRQPSLRRQAVQSAAQSGQVAGPRGVSFGFAESQPGSPVKLISVTSNLDYAFARVRFRNVSEHHLTAVTFLAVVECRPEAGPAILTPSEAIPVTLAPGESGEVETKFLRIGELLDWQRTLNAGKMALLGVVRVSFADGDTWAIKPPTGLAHPQFPLRRVWLRGGTAVEGRSASVSTEMVVCCDAGRRTRSTPPAEGVRVGGALRAGEAVVEGGRRRPKHGQATREPIDQPAQTGEGAVSPPGVRQRLHGER
ncbi:MAG: M56 family metallopeptidase [Acidobacteria bacterium]|nr:M56 family metallopeptidase [Acidobacteriota bacterium]